MPLRGRVFLVHIVFFLAVLVNGNGATWEGKGYPKPSKYGDNVSSSENDAKKQVAGSSTCDADVVVVGGGMSGMATAEALTSKKPNLRVVVLEGRDRVGGRIESLRFSNPSNVGDRTLWLEEGASWIHGVKSVGGEALMKLAKEAGVAVASRNTNYENGDVYNQSSKYVRDAVYNRYYNQIWKPWKKWLQKKQRQYRGAKDPGLQKAVDTFIRSKSLKGDRLTWFYFFLNVYIEHEYAGAISKLSLWYNWDARLPGGDKLVLGGYQRMVEYLARNIDVRLGHTVTRIDYGSSQSCVAVEVSGKANWTARRVVVTLPLGVLKQENRVRFSPPLPQRNRNAINAMGFGLLNKCIMIFPRIFWGSRIEFIDRVDATRRGKWEETLSIVPQTGAPVLYGFNAAQFAGQLETKSDQETCEEFLAILRKIWRNAPAYDRCFVTKWGKDEFSFGSYSFTTPQMRYTQVHQDVGRPVGGGRILFAGEHTSVKYPASVQGAYLSGIDAAAAAAKPL